MPSYCYAQSMIISKVAHKKTQFQISVLILSMVFCDEEAELDTLSPNLLLAVCVRSIELNSVSSKLCIY